MRRSALALLALLAAPALAEQSRRFDAYEIHYNAFNAEFIPLEVSRRHGLPRSPARGLLNVTVLRRRDDGTTVASEATIAVTVESRGGAAQAVRMRPIREDDALNYVGEFRLQGVDTYRFTIDVTPGDGTRTYAIRYAQELVGP
jgi:hypothetical protein